MRLIDASGNPECIYIYGIEEELGFLFFYLIPLQQEALVFRLNAYSRCGVLAESEIGECSFRVRSSSSSSSCSWDSR